MMGNINNPADHPAYNMPDPSGVAMGGNANPPSAPMSDLSDMQDG